MNKQELSAKWSKYCNIDKLVDDTMALLNENGHENTEHGVCTLLDKYFEHKVPLIKMFMTSKNYIGDMRIAVEKEFDRSISNNEVSRFFNGIEYKLYVPEMLKKEDENGKTLFDHLLTGKKAFCISDLPTAKEQKEKRALVCGFDFDDYATTKSHNDRANFLNYCTFFARYYHHTINDDLNGVVKIPKGTKTSRAFNKVCVHFGVDKLHPETKVVNGVEKTVYPYDKLFAEYSDLVSTSTRKMHFVIGLNPLDYLTMSKGINWTSCQNISGGGAKGGTISYMLDKVSIITFVVENLEGDIHKIPKVYRQMYHYEKNLFIQNRLYPQGNDGATNLYDKFRNFMIEEFTDLLGADDKWACKVGPNVCTAHATEGRNSMHYRDYTYNRNVSIFYPAKNEHNVSSQRMTIGYHGICVKCGKPYYHSGRLNHMWSSECED